MAEKEGNPQPQSGDGDKEQFRTLPEDRNKSEVGQKNHSLAPLLHWDADRKDAPSEDARSIDDSSDGTD